MNFNPRTDAIYSQSIKKKIDIKRLRTTRTGYRESFAPCTATCKVHTRPFCDGHLSIREVSHSALHITAAFLFSETPSLAVPKAGREGRADWVKNCLFRWHNWTLTLCWAQLTWHTKASDCFPSTDSTTNSPTVTEKKGKETTKSDACERAGFWHNRALKCCDGVPEVTISSPWTKRDHFASKSKRAAKAFWVTHFLSMATHPQVVVRVWYPLGFAAHWKKGITSPAAPTASPSHWIYSFQKVTYLWTFGRWRSNRFQSFLPAEGICFKETDKKAKGDEGRDAK